MSAYAGAKIGRSDMVAIQWRASASGHCPAIGGDNMGVGFASPGLKRRWPKLLRRVKSGCDSLLYGVTHVKVVSCRDAGVTSKCARVLATYSSKAVGSPSRPSTPSEYRNTSKGFVSMSSSRCSNSRRPTGLAAQVATLLTRYSGEP